MKPLSAVVPNHPKMSTITWVVCSLKMLIDPSVPSLATTRLGTSAPAV